MRKDEPIIFQVCNFDENPYKFGIPYCRDLALRKYLDLRFDIKVNTTWHKNVLPYEPEIELRQMQTATILVKPHGEYYAGWGRWFNWGINWRNYDKYRHIKYSSKRNNMLTAILSDPDYAHLECEAKIGDSFREDQYRACENLIIAPHEVLDDKFDKIGNNFRMRQYDGCYSLKSKPKEVNSYSAKTIGRNFRFEQYNETNFAEDFILPNTMLNKEYLQALLKNNMWIFKNISENEFLRILLKDNMWIFKNIPDELKTEEMCKIAVEKDGWALAFVPENQRTEEIIKIATRQANDADIENEIEQNIGF